MPLSIIAVDFSQRIAQKQSKALAKTRSSIHILFLPNAGGDNTNIGEV
jgi:hypothetical protein